MASRSALPLFVTELGSEPDPVPYWPEGDWLDGVRTDHAGLTAWWDAEAQSVLGVLRQAVDARLLPLAGELLRRLTPYLDPDDPDEVTAEQQRCEVADVVFLAAGASGVPEPATHALLEVAEAAESSAGAAPVVAGLTAAVAAGLASTEVRLSRSLTRFYQARGDAAAALDTAALGLRRAREIDDRLGEADATAELGAAFTALGRPAEAEPMLRRALALHRELGLPARVARSSQWLRDSASS